MLNLCNNDMNSFIRNVATVHSEGVGISKSSCSPEEPQKERFSRRSRDWKVEVPLALSDSMILQRQITGAMISFQTPYSLEKVFLVII